MSEAEKNLKESDGGQVRQQLVTSQRRCVIATVADTSTLRLLLYTDNSVQERRQAGRGVQQHLRGHILPGHLALQERIGECHLPHLPGHLALHERIGECRLTHGAVDCEVFWGNYLLFKAVGCYARIRRDRIISVPIVAFLPMHRTCMFALCLQVTVNVGPNFKHPPAEFKFRPVR